MNLGQDYEARFGQDFKFKFSQDADVWVEILKLMLSRDSEIEVWSRFVFELVIWTQPSGPLCIWQCLKIMWCVVVCVVGGQIWLGSHLVFLQ